MKIEVLKDSHRIIFAADFGSKTELQPFVKAFKDKIKIIKFGLEAVTSDLFSSDPILKYILEETNFQIMLDLKTNDVPTTVAGVAKAIAKYGKDRIFGFTIHALAGSKAMSEAIKAVRDNFTDEFNVPHVIAVTLLTSLDQSDLDQLGIAGTPREVVLRLSDLAFKAGIRCIVCSPQETEDVIKLHPEFVVLNPGIRFSDSDIGTQKRVTTPGQAIFSGASFVIMGSDLKKGDPVANIKRAAAEIFCTEYIPLTEEQIIDSFGKVSAIYTGGHFVYKKGGHGDSYVNKDEIFPDPDELEKLCVEIAHRMIAFNIDVVCGPTVGGVTIASYVAKALRRFTGKAVKAVFADENAVDGKKILKRGFDKKVKGQRVAVVEDIGNTGGSARDTCDAVVDAGGEVVCVEFLCNRSDDKIALRELVHIDIQDALLYVDMNNYPPEACPLCAQSVPINTNVGHGRQFLADLEQTDPEKFRLLSQKG